MRNSFHYKIAMKNEKSRFFFGHFSMAEVNKMCTNGVGSPTNSPGTSPFSRRRTLDTTATNYEIKKTLN